MNGRLRRRNVEKRLKIVWDEKVAVGLLVVETPMTARRVDMTPALVVLVGLEGLALEGVGTLTVLVTTGSPIRLPPKDVLFQMKFVRDV